MEDNFYQASSERLIATPKKQQEKLLQEKNVFERERPLATTVIERLEESIAFYEKVDSIENTKDPVAFMQEVEVNKKVCAILRKELSYIKTKASMYDKKELR